MNEIENIKTLIDEATDELYSLEHGSRARQMQEDHLADLYSYLFEAEERMALAML
jgi:hypothetical protein